MRSQDDDDDEAGGRICLFASEIGSLSGNNRFESVPDAIEKVVQRHLSRRSFQKPEPASIRALKAALVGGTVEETQLNITAMLSTLAPKEEEEEEEEDANREEPEPEDPGPQWDRATILATGAGLIAELDCARGVRQEAKVKERCALREDTNRKFTRDVLFADGFCVRLHGQCDALDKGGGLVEIKNRRGTLYRRVWPNELCQLDCYMYLAHRDQIRFLETSAVSDETFETIITWSEPRWKDLLAQMRPAVDEIVAKLRK